MIGRSTDRQVCATASSACGGTHHNRKRPNILSKVSRCGVPGCIARIVVLCTPAISRKLQEIDIVFLVRPRRRQIGLAGALGHSTFLL